MSTSKRIIIIGAGFAGLRLAQELEKSKYEILLIDKNNYHQFQPLLYQVATARLEPASIAFPLRKVFQYSKSVRIRIAKVKEVDATAKIIYTSAGEFRYDFLVMAQGCTTNYFGNKNLERSTFPMKSVPEALQLRNRILQTFEEAIEKSGEELQAALNFVIVGGGPTGVELAGALAEMKTNILPKDYPEKDFSKLTIYLIESAPNVLNVMSDASKKAAKEYLKKMGVVVMNNTLVKDYNGTIVQLADGSTIAARNVIWSAGIIGNKVEGFPEESYTRGGRLIVDRYNEVENLQNIYALGDISWMATPKYPTGHPQVASVAIEQAKVLARNFKKLSQLEIREEFEYHDKGSMATVGKRKAVVDLPSFSFQGRLAWLTWMFVHLMLILSVKNKLIVFINWASSYFSNDSTLRVMIKPVSKKVQN